MIKLILILILLTSTSLQAQADLSIIVHPESKLSELSNQQLTSIFLGKSRYLSDGKRVRPVELNSSQMKNTFYSKVAGKSEIELRKYWATLIFSGTGQPPKQFRSSEEILHYVINNKDAIGYISNELINNSVKVIKRIK